VSQHHHLLPCREIVELVTGYLDGALDETMRLRFEEHLAACPPCREYLAQMRTAVSLAQALSESPLSPTRRDDLMRAFREQRGTAG
jgi:anti-sigma factor RsiW